LRRDSPQASRSRHCRAGRPMLSPSDPRLLRRRGSGSRFGGPMPRRCPECKLAAPRQRPSAPRPREDGFWRQMAARPPRATRRAASAPSGSPASWGSGGRHVRTCWFVHAHLCRIENVGCTHVYALSGMFTRSVEGCPVVSRRFAARRSNADFHAASSAQQFHGRGFA
jgi:hypothetical protein